MGKKNLKELPFQELESLLVAWFKLARIRSAVINGTLLQTESCAHCHKVGL
jgi:hypothetical protein